MNILIFDFYKVKEYSVSYEHRIEDTELRVYCRYVYRYCYYLRIIFDKQTRVSETQKKRLSYLESVLGIEQTEKNSSIGITEFKKINRGRFTPNAGKNISNINERYKRNETPFLFTRDMINESSILYYFSAVYCINSIVMKSLK